MKFVGDVIVNVMIFDVIELNFVDECRSESGSMVVLRSEGL